MTQEPPPAWFGHEAIDLRVEAQLELLEGLEAPEYRDLFERLRRDPALSPETGGRGSGRALRGSAGRGAKTPGRRRPSSPETLWGGLVRNDYFPSPDAELYAAMIVRERPERIVEVGSGFSTVVARHAIEHAGLECELVVIDPEPRVDVRGAADRVVRLRVEESGLSGLPAAAERELGGTQDRDAGDAVGLGPVGPGTLLFIDSSHVIEPGGDGPFLYCGLLPSLPAGVLVHVHDIYIPYDYPAVYVRWGYTEQYLLHALLAGNPGFEIVCAPYLLSREHPEAMRRAFGDGIARDHSLEGASLWLRTV